MSDLQILCLYILPAFYIEKGERVTRLTYTPASWHYILENGFERQDYVPGKK